MTTNYTVTPSGTRVQVIHQSELRVGDQVVTRRSDGHGWVELIRTVVEVRWVGPNADHASELVYGDGSVDWPSVESIIGGPEPIHIIPRDQIKRVRTIEDARTYLIENPIYAWTWRDLGHFLYGEDADIDGEVIDDVISEFARFPYRKGIKLLPDRNDGHPARITAD